MNAIRSVWREVNRIEARRRHPLPSDLAHRIDLSPIERNLGRSPSN